MSDRVTVTITEGVADVRMNRPDKLNALDPAMFEALVEAGESLKSDASVRAVVLSGEGRAFCAGLDLASFQAMAPSDDGATQDTGRQEAADLESAGTIARGWQQSAWVWQELRVPVIAAIHGAALGGGIQLALATDIRLAAPDAKLSVLEIRWGIHPDMTGTKMLTRAVGLDVAKELCFTGRMVSGVEAAALGLVTRTCDDPRTEALALAAEIATKSPEAIRATKQLLNDAPEATFADQFAAERRSVNQLIGSANQAESVRAWFDKRDPVFADPVD